MSKREDILVAAERLFYRDGFHTTGIDRIVTEAGVTPRTLYRHFRSKTELVHSVLVRREERFMQAFDAALNAEAANEQERWVRLFTAMESWFNGDNGFGCMFLKALGEYAAHDESITGFVISHKQRILQNIRQRTRGNPAAATSGLAEELMLLIEGATAMAPVIGGRAAARHGADAARRLFRSAAIEKSLTEEYLP